jgi:phosphoribosylamine---glycine ligase
VLAAGIVDALTKAQIPVLGPNKRAAKLESSKTFAKQFMQRHGVPTAEAHEFDEMESFERHVSGSTGTLVVKKSGLAGGKGVLESDDAGRLIDFGSHILRNDSLLVEEFLSGWEVSVFALLDGDRYRLLPACADFKKAEEKDQGENTGGMGAICPVPPVTQELTATINERIVRPTLRGMRDEGLMYRGVLYFGLMITAEGPKLLEYNVRLGDPETQVLLPLIQSDFGNLCEALLEGTITAFPLRLLPDYAVGVVVASEGYPAQYAKGIEVERLPRSTNRKLLVFHASTTVDDDGEVRTGGGRCFTVVGVGPTILSANKRAYQAVSEVDFSGAWYRNDIGQRFLIEDQS